MNSLKPSGVPWVDEIPLHWQIKRLKFIAQVLGGVAKGRDLSGKKTIELPYLRVANVQEGYLDLSDVTNIKIEVTEEPRYLLHPGDILMNEGGDNDKLGRGAVWQGQISRCLHQNHVFAVRPINLLDSYWINWTTQAQYLKSFFMSRAKQTTNLASISSTNLKEAPITFPPLEERLRIVQFLDRKTAAIDALIAKKQRLIELLEEKRSALINQAVTKGLNPDAPMKDSGIPWIGEIPKHWEIIAIKRLARLGRKTFVDGDWIELPYITEEGVRLIQTGNVGTGQYREKGFRYVSEATFYSLKCTEVEPGNVLICRLDGPVGRGCLVPDLGVRMITSVDNTILKPDLKHDSRFIVYLVSCKPYLEWNQVLCRVGGGHRWRISRSMLGDLQVPVPPSTEQRQIADFLDNQTAKIISTVQLLHQQIEKLQEYRQSVITAAVTGKLDVTQAAVP